ncbi:MAG: hypothetical protein F4039_07005 [Gammaproteobacteria bacterium]|nr:hypothetical protein [Gammaproteobacteria bacterium]MYF53785.1 hypothetical protein [Gammaproteobacteria bacterium]MYK43818.1 hypothetical protein [Gammaproteobacteria bacterium]
MSKTRFWIGLLFGSILGIIVYQGIFYTFLNNSVKRSESPVAIATHNHSKESRTLTQSQLQNFFAVEGPAKRYQAFQSLTASLSTVALVELLEKTSDSHDRKSASIRYWLIEVLAMTNLELAWKHVVQMQQSQWEEGIARTLSQNVVNMQEALIIANKFVDPFKSTLINALLVNRRDITDEKLMQLARKLDLEDHVHKVIANRKLLDMLSDEPNSALVHVQLDIVDDLKQIELIKEIISALLNSGEKIEVGELITVLSDMFPNDDYVFERLIKEIAEYDPVVMWHQMLSLPSKLQTRCLNIAIEALLDKDLELALEAIRALSRPIFREDSGNRLMFAWAAIDSEQLLSSLDLIPAEFRATGIEAAIFDLAKKGEYDLASERLTDLARQGELVEKSIRYLLPRWSTQSPQKAVDWAFAVSENDLELRRNLFNQFLFAEIAVLDSNFAMEVAQKLPDDGSRDAISDALVIAGLAENAKFIEARRMMRNVRESMQQSALAYLGSYLIEYGRPGEAIKLAAGMAESDAEKYLIGIGRDWFSVNPSQLVERIGEFPSETVREKIARDILNWQTYSTYKLSPENMSYLQTFVQDDLDD